MFWFSFPSLLVACFYKAALPDEELMWGVARRFIGGNGFHYYQ
jgi:hypothetical protein